MGCPRISWTKNNLRWLASLPYGIIRWWHNYSTFQPALVWSSTRSNTGNSSNDKTFIIVFVCVVSLTTSSPPCLRVYTLKCTMLRFWVPYVCSQFKYVVLFLAYPYNLKYYLHRLSIHDVRINASIFNQ